MVFVIRYFIKKGGFALIKYNFTKKPLRWIVPIGRWGVFSDRFQSKIARWGKEIGRCAMPHADWLPQSSDWERKSPAEVLQSVAAQPKTPRGYQNRPMQGV